MNAKTRCVLYVDDELANVHAFQLAFEDHFTVVTAQSGEEALDRLASESIAVLVSDHRMPGMTGAQLCAEAAKRHPQVVRIIVTAYSDISAVLAAVNEGSITRYFIKPWREDELLEAILSAIDLFNLTQVTQDIQARLIQREQQATAAFLLKKVLQDLGSPTAALRNNLELLERALAELPDMINNRRRHAMDVSRELAQAVREALATVNDMAGRLEILRAGDVRSQEPRISDLNEAVQVAVSLLKGEIGKRARLVVDIRGKPRVPGERSRLTQIVANLLMNACEAIPPGHPEKNLVRVSCVTSDEAVILSVEDSGPAIPDTRKPLIFEAFNEEGLRPGNRGLGLAVVREIVEQMGGTIRVFDWEGDRGSRFVVELPLA